MALPNPYTQYQQQQVFTTPPDKLLLLLFDGAVRFCHQAAAAIERKDMEGAHTFIIKAERIIEELISSLNMDYAIAKHLAALYDYLYRRLVEANLKKDPAIISEVVGFLVELHDTWAQAAVKARAEKGSVVGGVAHERQ